MTIEITVTADLHKYGTTEDGQDFLAERFYVMAEAENGERWIHNMFADSSKAVFDAEIGAFYFENNRKQAFEKIQKFADRIVQHLKDGGSLDMAHWVSTDPRYGSEAYQTLDNFGFFKEREKMEDAGFYN